MGATSKHFQQIRADLALEDEKRLRALQRANTEYLEGYVTKAKTDIKCQQLKKVNSTARKS